MLQYCPADITEKFGKESFGMKKKYIGTVFFSLLLLLLFLPVFFYVIYYGNNVDYNAMHKIVTVEGNRVLFLCAIVGAAVLGILYYFLRKLPTTPRTITVFTAVTLENHSVYGWLHHSDACYDPFLIFHGARPQKQVELCSLVPAYVSRMPERHYESDLLRGGNCDRHN